MASYQSLGVRRVVNAAGFSTSYGSSCMSAEVTRAMSDAAGWYVDMGDLLRESGKVIARITGAEAGLVTSGAAGAMLVAAAACITKGNRAISLELPAAAYGAEVVVQKGLRTGFDQAITTVGATLIEVGLPYRAFPEQIEYAINNKTVALLYTIGEVIGRRELVPLEKVVSIGKARGVPVILDAAGANYPLSRLQQYAAMGVDLVATSGGKHIGGPPSTGLLYGRADLIAAARGESGPDYGIGRPLKVGKEEIIGLVTALEIYAAHDHEAEQRSWESTARRMAERLSRLPFVKTSVISPDLAGRPVPRTFVTIDEKALGKSAYAIAALLRQNDPPICVSPVHLSEGTLLLNPATLMDGDEALILQGFEKLWGDLGQ